MATLDLSKRPLFCMADPAGRAGSRALLNLSNCGEPCPDFDIGCAKNSPTCVISTFRNSWRSPADLTTPVSLGAPSRPDRDQIGRRQRQGDQVFLAATGAWGHFLDES